MKRKMMRLARGLKCGALGASGFVVSAARACSCAAIPARAMEPKPHARVPRAERREWSEQFMAGVGLVEVTEVERGEERLVELRPGLERSVGAEETAAFFQLRSGRCTS